ncbi:MAG: DUF420 domain-containing protein [Leptospiraceae bacterium]|nr:DUF420 domain-containing protein [Leptospiraceae bacterium]
MNLLILNTGMTISIALFYIGFYFRFKNNSIHRLVNTLGVLFNLASAVFLLYWKYMGGGIEAMGIFPIVPTYVVLIHRFFAALSLLMMLTMAYTGWKRKKEVHKKLHKIFLIIYTIVFISGLIIFESR